MASDISSVHWLKPVRLKVVPSEAEQGRKARLVVAQRMAERCFGPEEIRETLEMLGLVGEDGGTQEV